ncbi:MAG: PhoH family protein [Spirochaetales bacterium]|nr:PhoH family protein [Spirochaetales bacterium]
MNEYTIVVPDNSVLACVCGTNDRNLQLIEQHLGVPVFTKGNELSVHCDAPDICQKFQFIVDRIVDEIQLGGFDSEEVVLSVLNTDKKVPDNGKTSGELCIIVPGSHKKVYPRTQNQSDYIRLLQNHDMVFCSGSAGSGKTFLAVVYALSLVLAHKKNKLVITRPVVEAGESLGYLPGDLKDKIAPYLRPLRDAMEAVIPPESVKKLFESEVIEVAPLAYMRGRTLSDSVVILDEAQNTTIAQMKMFLTRMGENSKVIITGDLSQIDLPKKQTSGLLHALNILHNIDDIGFMELTAEDVVRNQLVKRIVRAYENEEQD